MATPRKIRNLRIKTEKLEQELNENRTKFFAAGKGWLSSEAKALDLKLSRQFKSAQKDLLFTEEMEQLRIKQEREIEAYRIKLELKTINKLAAIDAEREKIKDLSQVYKTVRADKRDEKEAEKQKEFEDQAIEEMRRKNPRMAKAMQLAKAQNIPLTEAIEIIERQMPEIDEDASLNFLIQQKIQEAEEEDKKITEFDPSQIQTSSSIQASREEDDGLSFLDTAFKPPEKSFMEKLKEQGAQVPVLDVKIEKEEKAS